MFKLDRLELSGFKSFVDPVHLDFSGGITGIVGPNGCGKSNVCDAVCWVLGERSAKNLRGQTMEDVIFSGSESRKRLGTAEVHLTLSTEASLEAAEGGKLTIGRRVHRSGESQYILNGKTVRLKDIRDLLMDTGLGIRAYSVIEQGKIGMILSGKPQERRRLLEEAAGVTRYKERRRIAEVKLEESRTNLARLDDILSEVGRSLRSLKRQAGAARRFKERKEAYQELLESVLLGRWGRLHADLAEVEKEIDRETDLETKATSGLQTHEAELLAGRETLDEKSRELAERHRREAELAARIEGKQEFIRGARTRVGEIDERLTSGRNESKLRGERLSALQSSLEEFARAVRELEAERTDAASEFSEEELKLNEVERVASESERRLEDLRNRLLQSIGRVNGLRNRLHQEQVEREKSELRNRHLADEFAQRVQKLQETSRSLETAEAAHLRLQDAVRVDSNKYDQTAKELELKQEDARKLADRKEAKQEELRSLEHTREVLEEQGRAQQVRRADLARIFEKAGLDEPSFLVDRIDVPEGWERSIDLYLGALADAILVPHTSSAAVVLNALADSRMTADLITSEGQSLESPEVDDPAVGASLGEALRLGPELSNALPPAFLVESPDDARRLAAAHPGVAFITRDRLWAQAGVLHIQGREARPGTLTREHDLAEAARRIPLLEAELNELKDGLEQSESVLARLGDIRTKLSQTLAASQREFAVADARREDLLSNHRRLSLEHETLHAEKAEITRTLALVAEQSDQLESELARSEKLHEELERDFDAAQHQADKSRSERELMKTTGASRKGRLDLLDQRMESLQADHARTARDISDLKDSQESWRAEEAKLVARQEELRKQTEEAEAALQEALEERERTQEDVLKRQGLIDTDRGQLVQLEEAIEAQRTKRDAIRETISELKVRQAGLRQEAEHLTEQFDEAFDRPLPANPEPPAADLAESEVELTQLKNRLDRTGPVNLLAAEEYAEHEERNGFLSTQRADVADSVASLKETIREINATSSERFLETFLQVNEYFGQAFQDLFRGGQAEMRLLDEDEPLECGIEIVARPPGKKLQNIMLMSGGEKALTAIALLFSLFRSKPSPFCILDEVDAPLDDINTLRFVEMLHRMSSDTQFVLITHNKLSMEATNRLYGVTMQERGVSRLVSVELDEIHPEPERRATA